MDVTVATKDNVTLTVGLDVEAAGLLAKITSVHGAAILPSLIRNFLEEQQKVFSEEALITAKVAFEASPPDVQGQVLKLLGMGAA